MSARKTKSQPERAGSSKGETTTAAKSLRSRSSAVKGNETQGYFAAHAAQLAADGYKPVPIEPGKKYPLISDWQKYKYSDGDAQRYPLHGAGLLTAWMPTADIDVRKKALAERLMALAEKLLGPAPVRIGQEPKRALPYRCSEAFKKLKTRGFRLKTDAPGAKPHAVEILGDGQQVVAYGIHPGTGKPYCWVKGGEPLKMKYTELTPITFAQAQAYLADAEKMIEADPDTEWLGVLGQQIEDYARANPNAELASRDPARTREQITYIRNDDLDYDDYVRVMVAVKGALGPEGLNDFMAWSEKSSKHDERWTRKEYARCKPTSIGAGTIEYIARKAKWLPPEERMFDRRAARLDLSKPTPPPEWIYPGYLPFGTAGGMTAEGGTAKTTFTLFEAIHIVLDRKFLGRDLEHGGRVLFVTAEDDRALLVHRLQEMVRGMALSDADKAKVEAGIFIEDISGMMLRLVEVDERGNLRRTAMGDRLITEYAESGLVLINFDPTNLFSPGERFVNDAEASMMVEGVRIARALGCTARFIHHVSKAIARGDTVDQYAGRGGAAFADNSRFQHHLVMHGGGSTIDRGNGRYTPPTTIDLAAIADEKVIRLHITKLSWAARPTDPIWLLREGFTFKAFMPARISKAERAEVQEATARAAVIAYVQQQLADGVKLSLKQLTEEHYRKLHLSRADAKRIVNELEQKGHLVYADLPQDECKGARKTYLTSGVPLHPEGDI